MMIWQKNWHKIGDQTGGDEIFSPVNIMQSKYSTHCCRPGNPAPTGPVSFSLHEYGNITGLGVL